ncbi:MAG: hypothetical protein KA505_08405 [Xanthomonadales bacterium]|nr:hypothetical protein [Xanthomonadales bacterium]
MPMSSRVIAVALCGWMSAAAVVQAADTPAAPVYDADLARSVGANENGMRQYVFVLLKTGPTPMPKGPARDEMFKGHFANMERLAKAGKLAVAGPFDGVDGWRGMFVFAVKDIEEAKALVATDPVVIQGEMVPEFHAFFGSAALMLVPDAHKRISKPTTAE